MHEMAKALQELGDQITIMSRRMASGTEWRDPVLDEAILAKILVDADLGGLSETHLKRLIRYMDAQLPRANLEYKGILLAAMTRYYYFVRQRELGVKPNDQ